MFTVKRKSGEFLSFGFFSVPMGFFIQAMHGFWFETTGCLVETLL